jgi:hypothetical protein
MPIKQTLANVSADEHPAVKAVEVYRPAERASTEKGKDDSAIRFPMELPYPAMTVATSSSNASSAA